jgi:hypothetical protein
MKKVTKPYEKEEAFYYSDFTGKTFGSFGPPVNLKIEFNYGSQRDGASLSLDLDDEDINPFIEIIKKNLCESAKKFFEKQLSRNEKSFNDSMDFRDWDSCDSLSNNIWLIRDILGEIEE